MVIVCNKNFDEKEENWTLITNDKFTLSEFQKWAIWGIIHGNHVLITAHTGSGKTLPAEFMIKWFTLIKENKKKVIYASPIKALSNQKLNDLRSKYPEISFGLLTGDIKDNPDADVLIMTTEILKNTLFNIKINKDKSKKIPLAFNLDIEKDLGGVIFDEVHYINDPDRGSVWEQSILLLPPQVQMLLLSATINKSERFADWIENEKNKDVKPEEYKKVILAPTQTRVVPLSHYLWYSAPKSLFDEKKNKSLFNLLDYTNKPLLIKNDNEEFNIKNLIKLNQLDSEIKKKKIYIKRKFVLNELVFYLKNNNMLPAICFVFSRKQAEVAAFEIENNLHDDEKFSSIIEHECKKILISKLDNYSEFIELDEFKKIIKLLEKGVAVHHAGILPILREMIELLFDKGFIKILFATETFAVGINMPTKTVIFSSLKKWDGNKHRNLLSYEYIQMSGRAGRRGLDKEGHIIHLNNLFELESSVEYKKMLCGSPPEIISKFKISYNIILNIIASNKGDISEIYKFIKQSLISSEIKKEVDYYDKEREELEKQLKSDDINILNIKTSQTIINLYNDLYKQINKSSQKQRKKILRQINDLKETNFSLELDLQTIKKKDDTAGLIKKNEYYKSNANNYLNNEINKICEILYELGFLYYDKIYTITELGIIASQLQEVNGLFFAPILKKYNYFIDLKPDEIVGLLSIFTNINLADSDKTFIPNSNSKIINNICKELQDNISILKDKELKKNYLNNEIVEIQFDLIEMSISWCGCKSNEECNILLKNSGLFLGDFIKAILKINNICNELIKIAEIIDNLKLLELLNEIPKLTMKYIVDNQSLYV
ncbi:DEAD/DEAH box helicase [bacterium]|nr:DEAD/DEAH box helicase [bacterium]